MMVLRLADAPSSAALTYDDVMRWSDAERRALLGEWLRDGGHMSQYTCTQCERECTEDVHWVESVGGIPRQAFIPCVGGLGRVYIRPETLRHWVIDPRRLVVSLRGMLATDSEPQEIVRDRLWRLGRMRVRGHQAPMFFARGATWRDASTVYASAGELQSGEMQVVLVPGRVPAPGVLGAGTKTVSLQQIVELGTDGLRVDLTSIEQVVPKSRARVASHLVPIHTPPGTAWNQVLIEFLDEERARVSVPGHVEERSFVEMGFQDRRKVGEQADDLWNFLRLLAREDGRLSADDSVRAISAASFVRVKKWVADIRARLRAVFPDITGDPFKPYRRVQAYETEFILLREGGPRRR